MASLPAKDNVVVTLGRRLGGRKRPVAAAELAQESLHLREHSTHQLRVLGRQGRVNGLSR